MNYFEFEPVVNELMSFNVVSELFVKYLVAHYEYKSNFV